MNFARTLATARALLTKRCATLLPKFDDLRLERTEIYKNPKFGSCFSGLVEFLSPGDRVRSCVEGPGAVLVWRLGEGFIARIRFGKRDQFGTVRILAIEPYEPYQSST